MLCQFKTLLFIFFVVFFFSASFNVKASGGLLVSEAGNNMVSPQETNIQFPATASAIIKVENNKDDNLWIIFISTALTFLFGLLGYIGGQLLSKFVIDPIHEQKKIIGEIADALIFYANVYTTPHFMSNAANTASDKLRQLATQLQSKTYMIPRYNFLEKIKLVPPRARIQEASMWLISLSNSIGNKMGFSGIQNANTADMVRQALGIYH